MIQATEFTPASAALGGALIGLGAVVLMASLGRIGGISGIVSGVIWPSGGGERTWRLAFVIGLLVAVVAVYGPVVPEFELRQALPLPLLLAGGFLVGLGVSLGSGCTSGHGVCGLARLSPRSLVATLVFLAAGIGTAVVMRQVLGWPA